MPEQDNNHKERILAGQIAETSSSDASIVEKLKSIQEEIAGTTGVVLNVTPEDQLLPKIVLPLTSVVDQNAQSTPVSPQKLTPQDSKSGLILLNTRQGKRAA